jgi:hypothetical protein
MHVCMCVVASKAQSHDLPWPLGEREAHAHTHTHKHMYIYIYIYIYIHTHTHIHALSRYELLPKIDAMNYRDLGGRGKPTVIAVLRGAKLKNTADEEVCMYVCMHVCIYVCVCNERRKIEEHS